MKCTVEQLYAFHLKTENAALIMPPGFQVMEVKAPQPPMLHQEMSLTVRILGLLTQTWVVCWEDIQPPQGQPRQALLVDRTIQGPFPFFLHQHRFTQEGHLTRLTDDLRFQPPLRPLGWLFLPLIYLQLYLVFAWRQARTKNILESSPA